MPPRPARTSRCLRPIPAPSSMRCRKRRRPAALPSSPGDWRADDLAGAALAIGALAGEDAVTFAAAARAHGVPVNIVDTPALSTFSFGSIVNRSPVVIGIATDGAAPVLGQAIRAKIEALLHPALGAWAAAAQRLRAHRQGAAADGTGSPQPMAQVCRPRTCGTRRADRAGLARPRLFRLPQLRIGGPGRRRTGRSGAAHTEGAARAAVGGCHPVRPAGEPGDPGAGAPRGEAHAGRQGRRRRLLPAGRHQPADGGPGARRQARGAAQGRRSHGVRPRRRGACRLPRRRCCRGGHSGHHGSARRRGAAADPLDRPAPHPPGAARHGARGGRRRSGARLAEPCRSLDHHGLLHERADLRRHAAQADRGRARPRHPGARRLRRDDAAEQACRLRRDGSARSARCLGVAAALPHTRRKRPCRSAARTRPPAITRPWRGPWRSPRR